MRTGTIFEVPLDQTLPYALRNDRRIVALAAAVAEQLTITAKMIHDTDGFFYRIMELDERVLDMLAYDLHVDWYDYAAELETKRNLIASSVFVHRNMGTPSAIYRVIEDAFGTGVIEEWFQYGGQPHHFRVKSENAEQVNQNLGHFLEMIAKAKPVSEVLEHVTVTQEGVHSTLVGTAERRRYKLAIRMAQESILANWLTDEYGEMLTDEYGGVLLWDGGI